MNFQQNQQWDYSPPFAAPGFAPAGGSGVMPPTGAGQPPPYNPAQNNVSAGQPVYPQAAAPIPPTEPTPSAYPANPAPLNTEHFICQNCGGNMRWDIPHQQFECASCRTPGAIQTAVDRVIEHPFEGYSHRAANEVVFPQRSVVSCQSCGAEISFDANMTATLCPMCGSSQVDLQKQLAGVPPDGIIPFRVDKAQAQENFRKWVKSRWFAPNRLKQAYQQGKLDGIYLPFWTFDADASAHYTGQGGRTHTYTDKDGNTHTRTDWYPVTGFVSASYDDIQVCAAQDRAQQVIHTVLPYNTSTGSLPYAGAYLSGFEAERYAFGADTGFKSAQQQMEQRLRSLANMDILAKGFDQANVFSLRAEYRNIRYKHVLLPAWLSAFAFSGKQYLYIINGENGRVGGQRPYSIPKIVAACLVGLAIVSFFIIFFNDDGETSAAHLTAPATTISVSAEENPADRLDNLIQQHKTQETKEER